MRFCIVRPMSFSGFTLIEIMAVLFIIGLILCIGLPSFSSQNTQVHCAAQTIVTILRGARQIAITRQAIYIVDINKDEGTVAITDLDGDINGKTYRLPQLLYFDINPVDIQFFPSGRAIKFGGGAAISSIWITSKKKPTQGDRITVLATTGRVKLRKNQDIP